MFWNDYSCVINPNLVSRLKMREKKIRDVLYTNYQRNDLTVELELMGY